MPNPKQPKKKIKAWVVFKYGRVFTIELKNPVNNLFVKAVNSKKKIFTWLEVEISYPTPKRNKIK